ncbi:MAG: hypothetical protein AABY05_01780, partial [Nanoarchaeota archaeon]
MIFKKIGATETDIETSLGVFSFSNADAAVIASHSVPILGGCKLSAVESLRLSASWLERQNSF